MILTTIKIHYTKQATAGLLADGRHLVNRARDEAQAWRDIYRQPIPGKTIADRLGQYISAYTLYSSVRPFGTSTIIGTMTEKEEPTLYMVEPSGVYWVSASFSIDRQ